MAKKRMLSASVISTDAFMNLSLESQALYMHLNLSADDDGFIDSPRRIIRMIGTTEKNLRELITSGFIIGFDSGICLVRHWKVNNNLKKDRYTETLHESERRQVHLENKIYEMGPGTEHSTDELDSVTEKSIHEIGFEMNSGTILEPQVREAKKRTEQDSLREGEDPSKSPPSFYDLKSYADEIDYKDFKPQLFLDYYEERAWKHKDGSPVLDWKREVRIWKEREKPATAPIKKNSFCDFPQREYPPGYWEELEKKLIAN